jgi:hypothetical protein
MVRRSAPASSMWVAKQCLKVCGDTCLVMPARLAASFTACQTIFSVMGTSARQFFTVPGNRKWLAARSAELLPVPYFHVVFTLPHELSALALQNKRLLYDLLYRTSAATMFELARDPKHMGGRLPITDQRSRSSLAMIHVQRCGRGSGVGAESLFIFSGPELKTPRVSGITGSEIARMWKPDGQAIALWS